VRFGASALSLSVNTYIFEQKLVNTIKNLHNQDEDTEHLTPLLGKTGRNSKPKYEKKPFKRKFKRTVEKVMKFAERNLALSEFRKSTSKRIVMDKTGSTEEFCDQVGYFGINSDRYHVYTVVQFAVNYLTSSACLFNLGN
jgi:hypothetical protein